MSESADIKLRGEPGQVAGLTCYSLQSLQSTRNVHILGLWEETRVPRANPRRHGEKTLTQKDPESTPESSCYPATTRRQRSVLSGANMD